MSFAVTATLGGGPPSAAAATWLVAIAVAVLTSGVTTAGSLFLWRVNRSAALFEKLVDRRLDMLTALTGELAAYSVLRKHRLIYAIAVAEEGQAQGPANVDSKVKREKRLQQRFPYEYEQVLEAERRLPLLTKQLILAQFYFGDHTSRAIREMFDVLDQSVPDVLRAWAAKYPEEAKAQSVSDGILATVSTHAVTKFAQSQFDAVTSHIMGAMRHELALPQNLWREA